MYSPDDTIVAPATPPGRGGLAVVRLSGARSVEIANALTQDARVLAARHATLVRVAASPAGAPARALDEAIATFFPAGSSYTGEDVVEFGLHGSPVVVAEVVAAAVAAGARMARPGEFTLRAFLNGRLDLTRAEAVHDLVDATTPVQAKVAFDQLSGTLAERIGEIERSLFDVIARLEASGDFPEEGYHFISPEETREAIEGVLRRIERLLADGRRGRLIREGVSVAIIGRPNVGKSTLFNRLAGAERAIVTEVPGTTRDVLTETVMLLGTRMLLADTAGVRESEDPVEREGVQRAKKAGEASHVAVVVIDGSEPLTGEDRAVLRATEGRPRVIAVNKCDAAPGGGGRAIVEVGLAVRAARGAGLEPSAAAGSDAEAAAGLPTRGETELVKISAREGSGVDELVRAIAKVVGLGEAPENSALSNLRHIDLLGRAAEALRRTLPERGYLGHIPEELILADLAASRQCLEEISGKRTNEDLLDAIFSKFCIGK